MASTFDAENAETLEKVYAGLGSRVGREREAARGDRAVRRRRRAAARRRAAPRCSAPSLPRLPPHPRVDPPLDPGASGTAHPERRRLRRRTPSCHDRCELRLHRTRLGSGPIAALGPRRHASVRRHRRARRGVVRRRTRSHRGPDRPERCREDDGLQRHHPALHPDSGEVELDGESLLRTPAHGIVRRGIARTFQNINLFRTMTRARERPRRRARARAQGDASGRRSTRSTSSGSPTAPR